jgi:hypothetical protein
MATNGNVPTTTDRDTMIVPREGEIQNVNLNPIGEQVVVASGETQEQDSAEMSPIPLQQGPTFFPIHSEDLEGEDDEILRMQIVLGDLQVQNMRRRIESKRRKVSNTASRSDADFDLTGELSREIDRDQARQLPEANARVRQLELEKAQWIDQVKKAREAAFTEARAQLQGELIAFKESLMLQARQEIQTTVQTVEANAKVEHESIVKRNSEQQHATLEANANTCKLEIQEKLAEQAEKFRVSELNAISIHESTTAQLRRQLNEAELSMNMTEFQCSRITKEKAEAEHRLNFVQSEFREAKAAAEAKSPGKSNFEVVQLRAKLEKLTEDHAKECSDLKAQINALDVKCGKIAESVKAEYEAIIEDMKTLHRDQMTEAKAITDVKYDSLKKTYEKYQADNPSYQIEELKKEIADLKSMIDENHEAALEEKDARYNKLRVDFTDSEAKANKLIDSLRGEIQDLTSTVEVLRGMQQNQPPDPHHDQDTYDYEEEEEWYEEDDEEEPEQDEEEPGDEKKNTDEAQGMESMFKQFLKFMSKAAKDDEEPKGKEADTVKIPQLPTAAQFKSWKNAVRSAVSSASRYPEQAFKWIMEVEESESAYTKLAECSKKFETLDAKLSSALTLVCKGELGRKITLRTEEEAKAMKLIRGRQILWLIYEEYRINEEAGSLNNITDLMKVTMRKDHTKVDQLSRFLLNWETVLAGIKDPLPDHQLQHMFYEQVRHVPSISNDIAVYDRAEIGSEERSYQFLIKAVKRVLQRTTRERNRKDIEKSLDHMAHGSINALKGGKKGKKGKGKGDTKGKGKGDGGKKGDGKGKPPTGGAGNNTCREWMASQTCKRGKSCPYEHPTISGWKFVGGAKAKAKPKGGGKGKPTSICRFYAAGHCRDGENCTNLHEGVVAATRESAAQPNAKAKAKAAAKATESGNV